LYVLARDLNKKGRKTKFTRSWVANYLRRLCVR